MTTNTDINELARQLREAAGEVSPQNIDSAQAVSDTDGYIECPHCSGEGAVNLEADYCNYDELPIGVQFYGIGTGVGAAERYFRAASPNNITVILDALEAAQQYAKSRDEENQGLMLTVGRLRVEREQLEASQPVVPEWRAINSRHPAHHADVLIYCTESDEQMVGYRFSDTEFAYAVDENGTVIVCEPSHWMPTPAAPALQEGE